MATKPKKRSFSALSDKLKREVRRSSETDRHGVALRDNFQADLETSEAGDKPESVHSGDRIGTDEQATADSANDTDAEVVDSGNDDEI